MTTSRRSNGAVHFSLSRAARVAAGALLSGCSADDLPANKLGNTSDLLAITPEAPPPRIPVAGPDGVDPFVVGEWVGYAEDLFASSDESGQRPAYAFPSGSSEIYLDIQAGTGGRPVGTVRFGSREAPEPQAGVPFGAGNQYYYSSFERGASLALPLPPVEGFAYALAETVARLGLTERLSETEYSAIGFSYSPRSAFENWCPLQPPLWGGSAFTCAGAASEASDGDPAVGVPCTITRSDDSEQQIDCNLLALCDYFAGPCDCTESGCVVNDDGSRETFWVAREGDQLIAHVTGRFEYGEPGHAMPIGAIRFDRVEP